MPIYKNNGVTYNIPDDKAAGFEAKFPGAMVALENEGVKYELPVSKKKGFMEKFPGATYSVAAPPAPKAEDINPTSDKSGYTFTAEELGMPDNIYRSESTSVAKLPEIKPLRVPRVSMGAEEVANAQPLTTFGEGVQQGAESLYEGGRYAIGEIGRIYGDSKRVYADALEYLDKQGDDFDASSFNKTQAMKDERNERFQLAMEDYRKEMAKRRKERENLGFFASIAHKWQDPERPDSRDYIASHYDDMRAGKAINAVDEALKEANGDVVKAREILENKAKAESWGDRITREAGEALSQMKPVEGAAWWGQMVPQVTGQAAAIGANFIPVVGKPLSRALAIASTTALTGSSAGSAMHEARAAGATDGEIMSAGALQAGIEYFSEKIPLERLLGKTGSAAFRKGFKGETGNIVGEEVERLLEEGNKRLGGKLLSGQTAKEFVKNVGIEAASEFVAEGAGTFVPMIYEDKENYPTLSEAFENAIEGAKAGAVMGGFLGGGTQLLTNRANNARRKEQGNVMLAETKDGVVEVLQTNNGNAEVLNADGEVSWIPTNELVKKYTYTYNEWENNEVDTQINHAYQEGYEAADEQKGAVKQAYDMERERVLNTFGEEVVQKLDNDPIGALMELNEVDRQEAIDYVNARTAYEGMIDRISDDIDERIKASDKEIESHANRQDGAIHPAVMRGVNGAAPKRVYVVNGNVATLEDGTIDKANSSSMIIVRDAETGEVSAASADDLESLDAVIDTEAEKKSVAEQIANEYAGQQAAIIETVSGNVEGENGVQPVVAPGDEAQPTMELTPAQKREEVLKRIPTKGKERMWTEAEPADVAEYIQLLTADPAKQQAAADKFIADIKAKQAKVDAISALEMDEQIAYWESVKALLQGGQPTAETAPVVEETQTPVAESAPVAEVETPQATNEMQPVSEPVAPTAEEIADAQAFADASAANTVEAYLEYLDKFPEGAYREGARAGAWMIEGINPETHGRNVDARNAANAVLARVPSSVDESQKAVEPVGENNESTISQTSEQVVDHYTLNSAGNSTQMQKDMEALRKSNREEFSKIQPAYELLKQAKERGLYPNELKELRAIVKGTSLEGKVDGWFTPMMAEGGNAPDQSGVPVNEEVGPFGRIYRQFKGKAKEAIQFLLDKKEGEAVGALNHPEIGDIDLVWGKEGTSNSDGYGLAKLAKYHPEVLDNLQEIINDMRVTKRSANRVQLESDTHQAAVRLTWDNKSKNWLLTAFEKKNSVSDNTTDTGETSNGGKQNDTATLQNTVSTDEGTTQSANAQENSVKSEETAQKRRKPSKKSGGAEPKQVNVESLMGALKQNGEAKLSDHTVSPSGNKLVTDERYAELRERMRKKLGGQMNIGVDPEILAIGTEMAVYHIEKGARKFADFAKGMIADLGDAIRPYLKAFYNGARELPEIEEAGFTKDMTPYEEVKTFDVANFDKQAVDAMATAETVTREAEVAKDVEAVKAPKKRESAEGKKLRKATQGDLEGNPVVYYKGEKHRILMLVHRGEQTSGARFTKPEITRVYLENMQDVKVEDLYVEDTRENVGESGDNSIPSQQTPVNNLNENNDGREENTATDNSGAQPGREELPDTEQVGAGVPVQDTARNSKRKRRNAGVGSSELGNGPQYDVNRNYTNEEIEEIVSSVTDIVDGKVVITGEVTDDIKAIVRGYESGGIAKKGRGILDEYYTDGKIVDAVNLLIAPYFSSSTPIRVLEPSIGIGNFIQAVNNIPTSEVVAFEINETTARIAKILYPDVDVNLRSFETEFIDESGNKKPMPQKYSLVIGNPPYGSHRGLYKGLGEESKIARYEDYFVKRSLDVLDEGGVLAMVLPSSWMDRHTKFGGYTIERAYRLPSGAFEATQVGTDIVILKKDSSVPVTEHAPYFEQFPERVLGEVKQRKGRYGRLEEYVEGDIDAAIEAIKKENAEQVADLLDIEKNNDALNDIESAVDETGSPEKAVAIVKDAQESEKADKKPAKKPSGKQGKYKVELDRGVETVPTSEQFTHEFSEGEVEAFADTDYEGALSNPAKHRRYANYIGGQAIHDFYYAEGDIYSKLAQLEQEKGYIIENYGAEQYEKQKALLESVLPKQKSLEEITISPNTTFVKNLNILTEGGRVSLKDMFVDFLRKLPRQAFGNSSSWEVVGYINNEQVHGTDKQRNQLIRERRKRVANDLFNKFLSEELSDNAKKQVVAAFNREYNSTYRPDYSKVPMFSTINRDFKGKPLKLTSVQLAGIGRMTVKGVGVLAHEVGFGKTLSGILAMHEAMTRGFAKKPLIVVPNDNILKQWVETIGEVLPNATVNTLGNLGAGYDLTDFKVNDGEFTIITYEGLKAMSFSDGTYNHLASKFSYITEDLNKHQSERDIQKEIEKKKELKGKMKRGTKSSYMFEDFGFDWLTVDEVHNANHIVSKVRLDKSVASDFRSQSQRTSDLGLKTWLAAQYIQEENNGRNVLLLSATPFTNKPLEYYSILSLVGNDMLERKGFFNVDQFFATFMEADNELEIGANGRPTQKTNVRRFRNNGLFQQLLSEFIDIKGEEDNPELVRPERLNKEYKIAQNELTAEAMAAAQELLSDNDTVLQGIGHARAAAFSPYATALLGMQPKNHKEFVKNSPKIDATIKMIEQNIKDRPDAGQIIYSEVGVEYFPLIRDYLVKESGLKPSEVRIITGATSNNERVNIQTAFNNGEVKVVIGSPAIKEGLNLQGNTTDMYILSLPWNFTQLRQIEGRGWRQGNRWENIRINYMLTNDSVDVFMLQRLQLKQGLYNEAMKSGAESLDVSDIDTAELKTALITDPAVRAEIVTVQERAKLQQEKTQIEADLSFVMRKYEAYNKLVEKLGSQKNTIKMYREWAKKGDEYWAQRAEREEAQLANIENEIEEEKQNLLKKGVNVDDIVRQTEQAQNAIAAIQEKIDNLKEFQEELTQKFREESEAKAKEQGDLVSTYIKERKAENKGGFYKIRPEKTETKATEEETEDGVLYREGEDVAMRNSEIVNSVRNLLSLAKENTKGNEKRSIRQQFGEGGFGEKLQRVYTALERAGRKPTAGVEIRYRKYNMAKPPLAQTQQEEAFLEIIRMSTNREIETEILPVLEDVAQNTIDDTEKADAQNFITLIERFKRRNERGYIIRDFLGANLDTEIPLDKIDELFIRYNSDNEVAEIYERVRAIAEEIGLTFSFSEKEFNKDSRLGVYSLYDNSVIFNAHFLYSSYSTPQEKASTIVHEMIHAVTQYAIDGYENGMANLPVELKEAAKHIIDIYEKAVKNNPILVEEVRNYATNKVKEVAEYGTTDVHEMIAELSKPAFRDKLKLIEYDGRNVWERLWDWIKSIFVRKNNEKVAVYNHLMSAFDTFIEKFDKTAYADASGVPMPLTHKERYALSRQGNGPLTDREVVMESDARSKELGKPRYYGKRQREFVARQRRRMAEKARQVAEKLNLDNVEVLESTEGLTGKKATSKGWFDPRTGKITVVVPNHGSIDDIVETVLHEAVAHYGLRKLFGENFKNFLDNVYRNVTPEIRAEITELAKKHGWDFHTATEEYLASLAENTNFERVNPSVWSNIKSFFMKMLAKVGITLDEPLGDNELRYILWRSHQNLVNPGWFNVFGQAEDIAKQYELGVGNYAESTQNETEAAEDEIRFREGSAPGSAREEYERKVRRPNKSGSVGATENVARRAQEAYQDSMLALKILQDAVAKETGNEVKDNENAYIAENRMSSSNKAMVEIYERDFFMPLMDEINALIKDGVEYDDIIRYLHAKHGLERNEYMRRKQAEEAARKELGEEPAMPNEGDADYEAKVNAKAAWRANLAELTESYVKKFAKRDYSGLTALTETANAKAAEAAAQQMVDEFENDHDTTPLWKAVNKATKETLRREFVGGLIDRATYDTVSTMFDFYIPLRGWDDNVAANEYEYFTNNNTPVFTPAIKTMHGRKSLSDDPIATIGYMAGSAIARANRNLMKQKFLNFVMNNPTSLATVSEQWYTMDYGTNEWVPNNPAIPEDATPEQVVEIVETHEANMRALEKAGKATRERSGLKIGLHATKQEEQQHVVRVMRNGKEYAVYINGNPRAAQALNGMTNPDVSKSKAREAAQNMKNFMARAFTSRNPAFVISNLSRDVIWAGTVVAAKEDVEYTKQYTKNVASVLAKFKLPRLLRKFQNGTLDMNNEIERYFDEFLRNGGETGFTQVLTVEDYKKNIARFTKEAKNGTRISKKAWRGLWNGIEFLNRSAEDITRFTVYMTSRQMGRSIERSVYDAKEITVNFNKKGSGEMGARYLNFAYIFFNATIQSLANFGKLVYRHPGKMAAALGTLGMMGFLMPVINAALMAMGDDDDEENYWNLPEWVRRNNIVLFVPWTEKGFITIPLPHEIRPFYGMGENAMSALLGKQTTEDAIKKSLVGFTGILPIDFTANGGDVVVNVMPTILQPFAQVKANVTHFGTPIYKDNDFNKRYPSWTKAYKGTNSTLVAATKWLNEATVGENQGGNVDKGLLDWNPAVIEHLFESYLGGMGKTFNKAATTVSMIWDEEARIARNIPVASSFYQEGDERTAGSQLNREYFDALEDMKGFQHRLSGYQKEITKGNAEYEKLFEDLVNSDEFMRYGIIKDYSNAISELNQVLKNNNPTEEKAQEIEGVIQELKKEMLDKLDKLQAEE